jgi:hypothetical protein
MCRIYLTVCIRSQLFYVLVTFTLMSVFEVVLDTVYYASISCCTVLMGRSRTAPALVGERWEPARISEEPNLFIYFNEDMNNLNIYMNIIN